MPLKIVKVLKNGTAIATQSYACGELTVRREVFVNLRGNGRKRKMMVPDRLAACSDEELEEMLARIPSLSGAGGGEDG